MSEVWIPIVGSITLFTMIGFIVYVGARTKQQIELSRAELQSKVMDKFANGAEFAQFAQTPEGRRLLHGASPRPMTNQRLLGWIRNGLVVSFLGVAFLVLSAGGVIADRASVTAGTILLAIGLGFLTTAFVSRRLSRAWEAEEVADQIA